MAKEWYFYTSEALNVFSRVEMRSTGNTFKAEQASFFCFPKSSQATDLFSQRNVKFPEAQVTLYRFLIGKIFLPERGAVVFIQTTDFQDICGRGVQSSSNPKLSRNPFRKNQPFSMSSVSFTYSIISPGWQFKTSHKRAIVLASNPPVPFFRAVNVP